MISKILIGVLVIAFSIYVLARTERFVRLIGHSPWAERYLGSGGTYTMWRVGAIIIIILAIVYMFGKP